MTDLRNGTHGGGLLAGIDIGGSKIAVLLVDEELSVRGRHLARTEVGDSSRAVEHILEALDAALATAGADRTRLSAVGVGVPGRVDAATGTVSLAVNLGWERLPLGAALGARLGRPVRVENDVRAAAAGLHARRALGDVDDLAYLSIGTGISAGVVLGGALHRGPRGMAGEIGHVVLDPAGPICGCGLRGCFESLASGPAIALQAQDALGAGRASSLRARGQVSAIDVFEHASAGDPLACELAETAGAWTARAVHELVMAYDVRRVAVGGGVASAGAPFLAPIARGLDRLRVASPLAAEALPPDVVELLDPGTETGTWGAVILARAATRVPGNPIPMEEVADA